MQFNKSYTLLVKKKINKIAYTHSCRGKKNLNGMTPMYSSNSKQSNKYKILLFKLPQSLSLFPFFKYQTEDF